MRSCAASGRSICPLAERQAIPLGTWSRSFRTHLMEESAYLRVRQRWRYLLMHPLSSWHLDPCPRAACLSWRRNWIRWNKKAWSVHVQRPRSWSITLSPLSRKIAVSASASTRRTWTNIWSEAFTAWRLGKTLSTAFDTASTLPRWMQKVATGPRSWMQAASFSTAFNTPFNKYCFVCLQFGLYRN